MKNYLNGTLEFHRLYLTYVLPRKKLSNKLTRLLNSEQLGGALHQLYDELIVRNPNREKFGEICFLAFNRLFDVESSLNLGVTRQLENTMIGMMQSSVEFTNSIFQHKATILSLDAPFEESGLDFYDREELYANHPNDHQIHHLMLPIFVVNTTKYENVVSEIFKPYQNAARAQGLSQIMVQNYISLTLGGQLSTSDKYYMSLVENENNAAKFVHSTALQIRAMDAQENSKKNINK